MNKSFSLKNVLVITFVLGILLFITACSSGRGSQSDRWEYKVIRTYLNESSRTDTVREYDVEELNRLGLEGWELVIYEYDRDYFIFKRRLP